MPSQTNGHIDYLVPTEIEESDLEELVDQINAVYLEEEGEIWPDDGRYTRITKTQLRSLFSNREVLVALDTKERTPAGCLKVHRHDDNWYFGMLVTIPAYRGLGIGKEMISRAEDHVREHGGDHMWLELLFAEGLHMPQKDWLKSWYGNMGYKYVETIDFLDRAPESYAKLMKYPCRFEIMKKRL